MKAMTSFAKQVLAGRTISPVRQFIFGASLVVLNMKDGGVRLIAVGRMLRPFIAKASNIVLKDAMSGFRAPSQLVYGTKLGSEATVHAARVYLQSLQPGNALLKLEFSNAFNSIHRDKILAATKEFQPEIYSYVDSAFRSPSFLFFRSDIMILLKEFYRRFICPLLFCLTIHSFSRQLKSVFMYFIWLSGLWMVWCQMSLIT